MIWIVGRYCDMIENSQTLIADFAENFVNEAKVVQLAILNATVTLFLKVKDEASQELVA